MSNLKDFEVTLTVFSTKRPRKHSFFGVTLRVRVYRGGKKRVGVSTTRDGARELVLPMTVGMGRDW